MQIQYEHLDYQKKAIDSVIQLFDGEPNHQQDGFTLIESNNEMVVANQLSLTWETIHKNLQQIQQNNGITQNDSQDTNLNFTIEMETGTGKTYVYLRTILQLNKAYGWRKFIIVVPSIAIREGVLQSLHSTKSHFADEFDNIVYHFNKYNSEKTNQIKQFAKSTQIDILVMNIQAFEKDQKNVINQSRENGKLIEFIQSTNPIVIIDEPQNISTDNRKNAIANLNPLFTVGYSATHKESYHKLYRLNPVQAYELNLVKQIAVRSVIGENDTNSTYLELIEITNKQGKLSWLIM